LPPLTLLWSSAAVIGLGCVVGFPAGLTYHLILRRELLRLGQLHKGWLWRPIQHHVYLDAPGMSRVRPWLWSGGMSFLLIMLGVALLTLTLMTHFR
jgi:hypothetical protein